MSMRPCPFCDGIDVRWSAEKGYGHRFKCTKCHAVGPFGEPDRGATARETSDIRTDAAAKLWNKRPPEDAALTLADQWEHDAKVHKARADAAEQSRAKFMEQLRVVTGLAETAQARVKELEIANDAYAHGPPAESQQLNGALARIKELEAEKKKYRQSLALERHKRVELENRIKEDEGHSKLIGEAAALISSPEFKNECDRLREKLAKCYGDRMVVDQRVKELEAALGVQEGMPR